MALTAQLFRSTPYCLAYRIVDDGADAAQQSVTVEAAGAATPDLLTDASGPLKEFLRAAAPASQDAARILLLGGSTGTPVVEGSPVLTCQTSVFPQVAVGADYSDLVWLVDANAAATVLQLVVGNNRGMATSNAAIVEIRLRHTFDE